MSSSTGPVLQVHKFKVRPSNSPADQIYSFSKGSPIITVGLAAQEKALRTSTLRLVGELTVLDVAGSPIANDGTNAGARLSSRVGVQSIIQSLSVSSGSGQVLEQIRDFGRLTSAVRQASRGPGDMMSESIGNVSCGLDSPSCLSLNNKVAFSIPLTAGILTTGVLPIGQAGTRGLQFQINLAADAQTLFGDKAAAGATYQISNVMLTGDLLEMNPKVVGQPKSKGVIGYRAWSSLYQVLNASDSTLSMSIPQQRVLSIIHNLAPADSQNNGNYDSLALHPVSNGKSANRSDAAITSVGFSKGGVRMRFGADFDVQTQSSTGLPMTPILYNAIDALQMPAATATHTTQRPTTVGYTTVQGQPPWSAALQTNTPTSTDPISAFQIGTNLDPVGTTGSPWGGQSYGLRVVSANDGSSPNSLFTHILSKQMLKWSPAGLQVSG